MAMEGDLTCGEHTIQYPGGILQSCIPETYRILLTNVAPINLTNKLKFKKKCFLLLWYNAGMS